MLLQQHENGTNKPRPEGGILLREIVTVSKIYMSLMRLVFTHLWFQTLTLMSWFNMGAIWLASERPREMGCFFLVGTLLVLARFPLI